MNNILHLLKNNAEKYLDKIALIEPGTGQPAKQISYQQLWQQVCQISHALNHYNIKPGDRILMMVPMSIDLYCLLLACLKVGAIAVFMDPWFTLAQLIQFCKFAEPQAIIAVPKAHWLRLGYRDLRNIPFSVTTGRCLFNIPAQYSLKQLLNFTPDSTIANTKASDTALITFTSGSSGIPKGADRSHHFLLAQQQALAKHFPYDDSDIDLTMFPVFALNNLATGITTLIPPINFKKVKALDAQTIVELINQYHVSTATASPPFWDKVSDYLIHHCQTLNLTRVLSGGAPVSNQQLKQWQQALPDTKITIGYGSTEAEPVAAIDAKTRLQQKNPHYRHSGYCMGKIIDSLQWKIITIQKTAINLNITPWSQCECPPGTIGELIVCGEHVNKQYYRNPQAVTANKIIDEQGHIWHRMGDTGFIDDNGYFWLVGRVHSTIIRDNTAYHAQQIEQALAINNCRIAALGLADDVLQEKIVIVIEHAEDSAIAQQITTLAANNNIPVDDLHFSMQPLPLDPRHNAKIDYQLLREQLS